MTVNRSDFQRRFKAEPDSGDRFIGMDTDDGSGDPFVTDLAGLAAGLAPIIATDASAISVLDTAGNWTATDVEGVLAEVPSRFLLRAADEFSGYSNGVPTAPRIGRSYAMFGGSVGVGAYPTVVSGKLTTSNASAAASYAQVELDGPVTYIDGRFTLSTKTTETGSAVLIAWDADIATTWPTIPNSPCHLAIAAANAVFGVWSGGSFTQVASWTFATPLATDGTTVHTAAVYIDKANSCAYVLLPDGTVDRVSHAVIGSVSNAKWACIEMYRQQTSDALAAFTGWSATDRTFTGLSHAIALDKITDSALNPVVVTYGPTSGDVAVPIFASRAAIDSTNLKVTVVAPASGKVLVELNGYLSMSGSTRVLWSLKAGATEYVTTSVVGQQFTGNVQFCRLLTGLTPGQSYTFEWWHGAIAGSTATMKLDGPNGYYATMKATPIYA